MAVLIFIIILSLLVFVHEFGHFSVAKWAGMKVEEFGFGFPPRLFGITRGETTYSVNLIPLGGFVKIFGESGEHRNEPRSFASRSKRKRFLVLAAGVAMNMLLAWVLFVGGFLVGLPTSIDGELPGNATIVNSSVQMTYVLPDSAADEAGVELGDRVLAINRTSVLNATRARELIGMVAAGESLELTIERDGTSRTLTMAPREIEGGQIAIGTQITTVGIVRYGPLDDIVQGTGATLGLTLATINGFGTLIGRLATGQGVSADIAGPVGIAAMAGDIADLGWPYLIHFTALLSINLAILNIIPFPALDGGRILFLIIEAARRKPVTAAVERGVHGFGFVLLILLVVLITYRDIVGLVSA